MSVPQIEKLNLAIDQASASFNRLLLLAGPAESGKKTLLRRISDSHECPILNVNLKISQALPELQEPHEPNYNRPRKSKLMLVAQ